MKGLAKSANTAHGISGPQKCSHIKADLNNGYNYVFLGGGEITSR